MPSVTLDRLKPGESAQVSELRHEESVVVRLMEMGLLPGQRVTMVRKAPMGDPIEYKVGETSLSLRLEEARLVEVNA